MITKVLNRAYERAMETERELCRKENTGEIYLRAIDNNGLMVGRKIKADDEAYAREMARDYWTKPRFVYVELFKCDDRKFTVLYHGFRQF